MKRAGARPPGGAYERAGRQAAVALRGYSSVLIVADNPVAAAHVAIGIALAEAVHRRVVIGDLAGEVEAIQRMVSDDDPHGLYDSFVFGTSLDKVIRSIEGNENLSILPSGTESAVSADILGSPRWRRIASDFAATDSLLLLIARADAPGLDKLAPQLDGIVTVGDPAFERGANTVLLSRLPHPTPLVPAKEIIIPEQKKRGPSRGVTLAAAAAVLLAAALFVLRPGGLLRLGSNRAPDTVIIPDSQSRDSNLRSRMAILPANPADSAAAAVYAVEILAANTAEGANFELQRHGAMMPAATISVVPIGDSEAIWYKVMAGAFTDSAQAAQLLRSLRNRKVVAESDGMVVRAPLALRVDSVPSQAGVLSKSREKIKGYAARGLSVYALVQKDGSTRLYAGAFERPEQSSLAATAVRVAGVMPVLEYRTGRVQ